MLAHQDGFPLADTNMYLCFYKCKGFEIHLRLRRQLIVKCSSNVVKLQGFGSAFDLKFQKQNAATWQPWNETHWSTISVPRIAFPNFLNAIQKLQLSLLSIFLAPFWCSPSDSRFTSAGKTNPDLFDCIRLPIWPLINTNVKHKEKNNQFDHFKNWCKKHLNPIFKAAGGASTAAVLPMFRWSHESVVPTDRFALKSFHRRFGFIYIIYKTQSFKS